MSDGIVEALTSILGSGRVSDHPEDLDRFSHDALSTDGVIDVASNSLGPPAVVVRPVSTKEVSRIVRLANERRIPIVPYGGGTGVMGAAISVKGCILVDLKGMDRILQISPSDMAVRVQPGVVLKDLEEALNKEGLMLGHDPWSLPIATVGGAISTDSVGYLTAKYGSMGQQVLGLEVVLPSGRILSTKGVPSPTAGPSLKHLLIGSEGTIGIITEATLRVFPYPERRILRAFDFRDFEAGFAAIMEMFSARVSPTMLDYYEEPLNKEIRIYLAFEGFLEEVGAQDRRAMEICLEHGGTDLGTDEANKF